VGLAARLRSGLYFAANPGSTSRTISLLPGARFSALSKASLYATGGPVAELVVYKSRPGGNKVVSDCPTLFQSASCFSAASSNMLSDCKPCLSSAVGCWESFGPYSPYKVDLSPESRSLGCMVQSLSLDRRLRRGNWRIQRPATMSRQNRNQQGELTYPHFALIYIDRDGNLCHEASRSIADSRETILSPRVTNEFLRAVARSRDSDQSHSQRKSHTWMQPGCGPGRCSDQE